MSKKIWFTLLAILMIATLVLSACGQATPEPTEAPPEPGPEEPAEPAGPEEPAAPEDVYGDVDPSGQTYSTGTSTPVIAKKR